MQVLIKNADLYAPKRLGKKDILLSATKVLAIENSIDEKRLYGAYEVIDAKGRLAVPGFIDTHQHFTGGGGEGSFKTRVPELLLTDQTLNGVTTALGLLGTDSQTRSIENLYAKTMAFREEGISSYMLTGSYAYPSPTLTNDVERDIVFLEPVIGVKLAISDHRGPYTTIDDIAFLTSKVRVASLVAGKAGIITLHTGIGKNQLKQIRKVIEKTDYSPRTFVPTHINREDIFEEALNLARLGAIIDGTAVSKERFEQGTRLSCAEATKLAKEENLLNQFTFSSDAGGSLPVWNEDRTKMIGMGVGSPNTLLLELQRGIENYALTLEDMLQPLTVNAAKQLGLATKKGQVNIGYDADLLLLDRSTLAIDYCIAQGAIMVEEGKARIKGTFET